MQVGKEIPQGEPDLQAAIKGAKAMIGELFALMEIKRVVVVDDEWASTLDVEGVLAQIAAIKAAEKQQLLQEVRHLENLKLEEDPQIWDSELRARWERLGKEAKAEVWKQLRIDPEDTSKPSRTALEQLLGSYDLRILSLEDWNAWRTDLLAETQNEATLFLFDQNMEHSPGGAKDTGMRIIATLLKSAEHSDAHMCFALVTNLVNPNAEYESHEQLAAEYELADRKHRFVVISKQHLHTNPQALAFRLKRIAISPWCSDLRDRLFDAIRDAYDDAKAQVDALSIYDFEQIVFQSSYQEGVWEPDTLLRIFGLFHRAAARNRAKADAGVTELATKVRQLILYPYLPEDLPKGKAADLSRLELYEEGAYLQAHHMPVDAGDIFQKVDGNKQYILLEQPCDIIVRGDSGKRKLGQATLAEIVKRDKEKEVPPGFVEIPFYFPDSGKRALVKLTGASLVPLFVLDLCVFPADGVAAMSTDDRCSNDLIPAWQKRFEHMKLELRQIIDQYRSMTVSEGKSKGLANDVDRSIQNFLTGSVSGTVSGKITLSPDRVSYNLKRVRRLKQPRCGSLLRDCSYYKSRDAFEHDLTRTVTED